MKKTLDERIAAYLHKCPPAISGQHGHNPTFAVACALVNGFALSRNEALSWLKVYSQSCIPPWSEAELIHKVESAANTVHQKPRGHMVDTVNATISTGNGHPVPYPAQAAPPAKPKRTPVENATWWLSGNVAIGMDEFVEMSQLAIPQDMDEALCLFLEMLYEGTDLINVVSDFIEETNDEGVKKAKPRGPGVTRSRDEWTSHLRWEGVPTSEAGVWMRPNPCRSPGSGANGAVTDSDITAHRFMLVESDVLPLPMQLALYSRLKLPFCAVFLSGGNSAHAWVRVDAKNATEYSDKTRRIITLLQPFGIDHANKNPSRLSRLPGAHRTIGAVGDGIQRLLWLNPGRKAVTDQDLQNLEDALQLPAIEEKPFKHIVSDALIRYQDLHENKNPPVVPTGIAEFDADNGGLHPGQMTILSAQTGHGKSSLAVHIANAAVGHGRYVAMFNLEMSNDEVVDLMFAMNAEVDRNHFNTGNFTEEEMTRMVHESHRMSDFPFWTYEESILSVSQIRSRVLQLKREAHLDLVIVDYAQIVSPTSFDLPREQQVAGIAKDLRALAKDAKIPILVLSQLNDDGRIRESRVIGFEAHCTMAIENDEDNKRLKLQVTKGRRVRKKEYILFYEPRYCRIGSLNDSNSHPSMPYNDL